MSASSALPLPTGPALSARQRFLSRIVEQALSENWRSPQDFLDVFTPQVLLNSLENNAPLRVKLLVATTGVNERLAERKTPESAAEDLFLSLDEGLTTPAAILALLPAEDRARHLNPRHLWEFATGGNSPSTASKERAARDKRVKRTSFLVDTALQEGLLRLEDVTDGLGFHCIATSLPHTELQRIVEHALSRAREGQRLTEEQLLEAVPLTTLMKHAPQDRTWKYVILERLAIPLGFVESEIGSEISAAPHQQDGNELPPQVQRFSVLPPALPSNTPASLPSQQGSPPHTPAASTSPGIPRVDPALLPPALLKLRRGFEGAAGAASPEVAHPVTPSAASNGPSATLSLVPLDEDDSEATQIHEDLDEGSEHPTLFNGEQSLSDVSPRGEAMGEFARVTGTLRHLRRLPETASELSLLVLLSIESMYEELANAVDDGHRQAIVREAFPNATHLRVGMIALIRLLDPEGRTDNATLNAATSDSLIQTLLFEEARLRGSSPALDEVTGFDSLPPSSYS